MDDAQKARFQEISIPGYERLGAPRVGQDEAANAWTAWEHKLPEEATAYGRALLEAADAAAVRGPGEEPPPKRGFLAALGFGKTKSREMTFDQQLDVVRSCGRWYVFWGERGHPIAAWY